jgi:hypothetical protein
MEKSNKNKESRKASSKHEAKEDKPVKVKEVGATAGLDMFDYSVRRTDAREFNSSRQKLLDYAAIHYPRAAHVIEHLKEYDFEDETPVRPTRPVARAGRATSRAATRSRPGTSSRRTISRNGSRRARSSRPRARTTNLERR